MPAAMLCYIYVCVCKRERERAAYVRTHSKKATEVETGRARYVNVSLEQAGKIQGVCVCRMSVNKQMSATVVVATISIYARTLKCCKPGLKVGKMIH